MQAALSRQLEHEADWGFEKSRERKLNGQIERCKILALSDGVVARATTGGGLCVAPLETFDLVHYKQHLLTVVPVKKN